MNARVVTANASTLEGLNTARSWFSLPPLTEQENADRAAKSKRMDQLNEIERTEFARARREREDIIRDRIRNGHPEGETYAIYLELVNAPFERARERVREQMVCPVAEEKELPSGGRRVAA